MNELFVLLDNREVGCVRQDRGRLKFTYMDSWRSYSGAYPLSLSMPLAASDHPHSVIEPFIWGLLPDNEFVLSRWAQRFQVSPRNAFSLIAHVGEDCAGAVQFVTKNRKDELLRGQTGEIQWLEDAEVASRLRNLQNDASVGRIARDTGQFSLPGAQPKTALVNDGKRWGIPTGREPTTHILKPPSAEFDGHAENEHLCLSVARALGLPTANSEVQQFEDVTTIVVKRYDRVRVTDLAEEKEKLSAAKVAEAAMYAAQAAIPNSSPDLMEKILNAVAEAQEASDAAKKIKLIAETTKTYRIHQEDFCQALRIHPSRKYQNEGGPGPKQIVDLLKTNTLATVRPKRKTDEASALDDITTFLDALIFNWIIGGTDAHAKNYSILIGGGGLVRLAPLYDIASIFAYADIDPIKAKLAMKIGGEYLISEIGLNDWRKLAATTQFDEDILIERLRNMASKLPDCLSDEILKLQKQGISHNVINLLSDKLPKRAEYIRRL